MKLAEIVDKHGGKIIDKWASYLSNYERELQPYRQAPGTLIEIGVQNCGSLEVWAKYFPNLQSIIGVDIVEDVANFSFDDSRISTHAMDAKQLHNAPFLASDKPVLIIEDASHTSSDIIITFLKMFPHLKPGGLYVIEDLCCSYWGEFNKDTTITSVDFFKGLVDSVFAEHWLDGAAPMARLIEAVSRFDDVSNVDVQALKGQIKSITFQNSMCFVEKAETVEDTLIGPRVVRGQSAPLGFKAEDGQDISEIKKLFTR